jgi:putative ABC transport system permease protein
VSKRRFGRNLRSLKGWRDARRDVRDEMRLHCELRADELEAQGLAPADAMARAHREVGDPEVVEPMVISAAASADRASAWRQGVEELGQDLRHALRALRRAPGFTALALLTIALGLGANAAVFGVVNAAFFAPLPFDPGGTLVRVREYRTAPDGNQRHVDASRHTADAVAARPDLFSASVPLSYASLALARHGGAIRVAGTRVGRGFAEVMGVEPVAGRVFTAAEEEEDGDGAGGVALVSTRLSRSLFGSEQDALGRTLRLDERPFLIVGVLPAAFHVPYGSDVWVPARFAGDARGIFLLARRAPGVTLWQIRAELESMGRRLQRDHPDVMLGLGVTAVGLRDHFIDDQDRVAVVLMGSVAFLVLIACSNVALLLTTRFAARRRDVVVRAALGCGRGRQVRQFVTEAVTLFAAGGAAGLLLMVWLRDAFVVFVPEVIATQVGFDGIPIDWRVVAFSAGASFAAGAGFGLLAALHATRGGPNAVMKGGGRSVAGLGSRGMLGTLVVIEVALALVLMTAAGAMLDAFSRLRSRDLGLEPRGVLTMRLDLTAARYGSPEARAALVDRLLARARALPRVESAGATTVNPLCCDDWRARVVPDGLVLAPGDTPPIVRHFIVTPGYSDAVGQRIVRGRAFSTADVPGAARSVIVDEAFVVRFWPGQNPIGRRIRDGSFGSPRPWLTVVGVAASAVHDGDQTGSVYLPHAQNADGAPAQYAHLMLRVAGGEPASLAAPMRAVVAELDSDLPAYDVRTLASLVDESLAQNRFGATVTTLFAMAGLLLAVLGLYGALSCAVTDERREIGVRMALGGSRGHVLGLVSARAARLLAGGLLAGAAASFAASRVFAAVLGDAHVDAGMFAASAAVLLLAGMLAALVTARRAMKLDPLQALGAD